MEVQQQDGHAAGSTEPAHREHGAAVVATSAPSPPADGGEVDLTWELSKENVRPLTRGRKVERLKRAFGAPVADASIGSREPPRCGRDATDKAIRTDLSGEGGTGAGTEEGSSEFEARLEGAVGATGTGIAALVAALKQYHEPRVAQSAESDDPLAAWLDYIKAVQDYVPSDQKEQFELLERCSRTFKDSERYKDDSRYLKVWLAYAKNLSNSEELFKFLYKKKIGQKLALFWLAWALVSEQAGRFPFTEKLLTKGIDRLAEPVHHMKKKRKEFLRRMRRHYINHQIEEGVPEDSVQELPDNDDEYKALLQTLATVFATQNGTNANAQGGGGRRGLGSRHDAENSQHGGPNGGAGNGNAGGVVGLEGRGGRRGGSRGLGGAGGQGRSGGGGGGGSTRGGQAGGNNGAGFVVFVEAEFEAGGSAARRGGGGGILDDGQQSNSWTDFGTRESRERENILKPAKWSDGALGDRPGVRGGGVVAVPTLRTSAPTPFAIHVDEEHVDKQEEAAPVNEAASRKRRHHTREDAEVSGRSGAAPPKEAKESVGIQAVEESPTNEEEQIEEVRARYMLEQYAASTIEQETTAATNPSSSRERLHERQQQQKLGSKPGGEVSVGFQIYNDESDDDQKDETGRGVGIKGKAQLDSDSVRFRSSRATHHHGDDDQPPKLASTADAERAGGIPGDRRRGGQAGRGGGGGGRGTDVSADGDGRQREGAVGGAAASRRGRAHRNERAVTAAACDVDNSVGNDGTNGATTRESGRTLGSGPAGLAQRTEIDNREQHDNTAVKSNVNPREAFVSDGAEHTGEVMEYMGDGGAGGGSGSGGDGGDGSAGKSGWQRRLTFDHAVEWQAAGSSALDRASDRRRRGLESTKDDETSNGASLNRRLTIAGYPEVRGGSGAGPVAAREQESDATKTNYVDEAEPLTVATRTNVMPMPVAPEKVPRGARGDVGGVSSQVGGGDDMTINTRLVMEEMNEWFADDPINSRDNNLGIEDDGDYDDCANDRSVRVAEPFEVFEDPDGSIGDAVTREKAQHEQYPAFGDENGLPPMPCGFDGADNDENQENLGVRSNPHARNVRDPGVENAIFQEREIPRLPPGSALYDEVEYDEVRPSRGAESEFRSFYPDTSEYGVSRRGTGLGDDPSTIASASIGGRRGGLGDSAMVASRGHLKPRGDLLRSTGRVTNRDMLRQLGLGTGEERTSASKISGDRVGGGDGGGGSSGAGLGFAIFEDDGEDEEDASGDDAVVVAGGRSAGACVAGRNADGPRANEVASSSAGLGFAIFEDGDCSDSDDGENNPPAAKQSADFPIFVDDDENGPPAVKQSAEFAIFEDDGSDDNGHDDENRPAVMPQHHDVRSGGSGFSTVTGGGRENSRVRETAGILGKTKMARGSRHQVSGDDSENDNEHSWRGQRPSAAVSVSAKRLDMGAGADLRDADRVEVEEVDGRARLAAKRGRAQAVNTSVGSRSSGDRHQGRLSRRSDDDQDDDGVAFSSSSSDSRFSRAEATREDPSSSSLPTRIGHKTATAGGLASSQTASADESRSGGSSAGSGGASLRRRKSSYGGHLALDLSRIPEGDNGAEHEGSASVLSYSTGGDFSGLLHDLGDSVGLSCSSTGAGASLEISAAASASSGVGDGGISGSAAAEGAAEPQSVAVATPIGAASFRGFGRNDPSQTGGNRHHDVEDPEASWLSEAGHESTGRPSNGDCGGGGLSRGSPEGESWGGCSTIKRSDGGARGRVWGRSDSGGRGLFGREHDEDESEDDENHGSLVSNSRNLMSDRDSGGFGRGGTGGGGRGRGRGMMSLSYSSSSTGGESSPFCMLDDDRPSPSYR